MNAGLCKRRCFPPVALAWDAISGLHVFPNLYSETIVVYSSPALWSSSQNSDNSNVLLLVLWLKNDTYWNLLSEFFFGTLEVIFHLLLLFNVFLYSFQIDPHCSYASTIGVSVTASSGRFLLLYFSQVHLFLASIFFKLGTFGWFLCIYT